MDRTAWERELLKHIIKDERYTICKICYYRMTPGKFNEIEDHFRDWHRIVEGNPIGSYVSIPIMRKGKKIGETMTKFLESHFYVDNGQNWRCKHCIFKIPIPKKQKKMDEDLRENHPDEYKKLSPCPTSDDHDTAGSSDQHTGPPTHMPERESSRSSGEVSTNARDSHDSPPLGRPSTSQGISVEQARPDSTNDSSLTPSPIDEFFSSMRSDFDILNNQFQLMFRNVASTLLSQLKENNDTN